MEDPDQFVVEPPANTPPGNQPANKPQTSKAHETSRFVVELIRTAIIVSILAYAIRFFVLQPFVVEGSSMFPRFETNDFLIVDKISYHFHKPQRGDIIVFKFPGTPPGAEQINYVKRVIGLPGDTVVIENGRVKVIDSAHPQGVVLDEPYVSADNPTTITAGTTSNTFKVDANSYFVLGDNRKASSDSREWGLLPADNIIGRVVVEALPLDRASFIGHTSYPGL